MRFIKTIADMLGLGPTELGEKIGVSGQNVWNWMNGKTPKQEEFVGAIRRLRKLSGLSWSKFGALIDAEYDDKKKE